MYPILKAPKYNFGPNQVFRYEADIPLRTALRSSGKSTNGGKAIEAFPQSLTTDTRASPRF